eukprot:symbB.v1.2.018439.t1/scaffold1472.1/size116813/1
MDWATTMPEVLPDEVAEAQQHVIELQQMMEEKPESWVVELLHVAAYKDNTLGHALYATEQEPTLLPMLILVDGPMEVISGQYSPVGRQTERSLRRLRTQVEAEEALLLPKTPKAEDSKQNELDSPKSEKINLDRFPWPNSPSKAGKLSRSGTLSNSFHLTASTVATLNGTTGSFEETTKSQEKDEETSKSLKASVAFSAMGQDAGQLCEVARSKYRRFMLPSKDSRPEAGHYRVNDSCSFQRPPEWDIGQRPLHQGRKVKEKNTGMELGEMYNGFADGLASQGKFQPMALSPWRPDVTSFLGLRVELRADATKPEDLPTLGPRLAANLVGRAFESILDVDRAELKKSTGWRYLLEFLEKKRGREKVDVLGDSFSDFFLKKDVHRREGESLSDYEPRFRQLIRRLEKAMV